MNLMKSNTASNPFTQGNLVMKLYLLTQGRIRPAPSICAIGKSCRIRVISNVLSSMKSTSPFTVFSKSSTTIHLSMSKSSHTSVPELHSAKYARNLLTFIPPCLFILSMVSPAVRVFQCSTSKSSRTATSFFVLICPAEAEKNTYL